MNLEIDFSLNVVQAFLVFSRLAAFILVAPVFNLREFPVKFKVTIIFFATMVVLPVLPDSWSPQTFAGLNMVSLLMLILSEVLLGLLVAVIVRMMMEILALGGFLVDRGMGYAMTSMFAPGSAGGQTLISLLFVQLFLLTFLIQEGHHDFIRLSVATFYQVKPGAFAITESMADGVIKLGSDVFREGFRLSLPIFGVVMTVNLSMAIITKFAQEFQVMMLSFPIRLAVGLFVISNMIVVFMGITRNLMYDMLNLLQYAIIG